MSRSFLKKMVDWLAALFVVSLLSWFILTEPMLPSFEPSEISEPDPTDLKRHVVALSQTYSPRIAEVDNLRPPARYIKKQFDQFGDADYQPYRTAAGTVNNVIARFGPNTRKVIVIGANYDANEGLPGADGNASGVAGLIELAGILSERNDLPIRVELVAYALSEGVYFGTSDMGSYYHAQSLKNRNREVVLMMSLDSIGYFSDKSGSQQYPYSFMKIFYPSQGDYIKVTGRLQDIPAVRKVKHSLGKVDDLAVRSLTAPEIFHSIATSDSSSYWQTGVPAITVTDTAGDRNPAYNTQYDVAQKLDYIRMAKVVQGVGQAIVDIARELAQPEMLIASKEAK